MVIIGKRKTCEACAYAKAKAKGVPKKPKPPAEAKGERLYLDISGPYKKTVKGSQYWVLIVDDKTRKAWSFFVPKKSDVKKVAESLVLLLKGASVTVKYLHCDNAGENVKGLTEVCHAHGISLELTAPHTPQTNGVVERKFVTIRDRAQAMMLGARLDDEHQGKLWAEAVSTATRLHNAVPNRMHATKCPDELWYGEKPRILDHLVQWGRIGYVKERGPIKKLDVKSTKMVCMGYAVDHASDVYRMYNPDTGKIIHSRDITWADWHGSQDIPISLKMFAKDIEVDESDDQIGEETTVAPSPKPKPLVIPDDEVDEPPDGAGRKIGPEAVVAPPGNQAQRRLERELARLNTYYNPTTLKDDDDDDEDGEIVVAMAQVFNVQLDSDPGEPKSMKEALASSQRREWIIAINNEIENFLKRKVWTPTDLTKLSPAQKPIKVKWVFKKKDEQDGSIRFKARLVVKGFVQIPGIDFTNTHSPVAQDSSIRTTLAIAMVEEGWEVEMIDIEAAFLEAELDEDIYIEWPEGVEEFGYFAPHQMEGRCLKLERAMYGCVQSPLMFFKTFSKHLQLLGLSQSLADPCIWYKHDEHGHLVLVVAVYVDDCIVAGPKSEVEALKAGVRKRFKITELGAIRKHLGVWYEHCKDEKGEYYKLSMDQYQKDILADWKAVTGRDAKPAPTPGFPNESLTKNQGKEVDKENYCKLLGRLMWFVRKLMPEALNAIRELAMFMDN